VAVKPLPVAALAAATLAGAGSPARRWLGAGLAVSAAADLAIEASFTAGLLTFLLAHLLYVRGFHNACPRPRWLRLLPPAAYAAAVLRALWPGLGPLRVPVALYVAALVAVLWRASACLGRRGRPRPEVWMGVAGTWSFAVSDTLIALDRFHAPIPGARVPIMALYWLGQSGIALFAARDSLSPAPAAAPALRPTGAARAGSSR
jgi:uncharacterized membrane protein YhhN